jgi:hypothetical protein
LLRRAAAGRFVSSRTSSVCWWVSTGWRPVFRISVQRWRQTCLCVDRWWSDGPRCRGVCGRGRRCPGPLRVNPADVERVRFGHSPSRITAQNWVWCPRPIGPAVGAGARSYPLRRVIVSARESDVAERLHLARIDRRGSVPSGSVGTGTRGDGGNHCATRTRHHQVLPVRRPCKTVTPFWSGLVRSRTERRRSR